MRSERNFKIPILSRFSLRANLLILLALVTALLFGDGLNQIIQRRDAEVARARDELLHLAQQGAARQGELISAARGILTLASSLPEADAKSLTGCQVPFRRAIADQPWLKTMSVIHPMGHIVCTTNAKVSTANLSDREYFKQAIATRGFVVSDFIISRILHQPVIVAAMPRVHQERIESVVTAAIDLNWLSRLAGETVSNRAAEVLLLDAQGTVLAAYPDEHAWIGRNLAWQPDFWGKVQGDTGVFEGRLFRTGAQIVSFAKLPNSNAILTVLREREDVLAGPNRAALLHVSKIALFSVFCFLAVWWGGEQLVLRPICELAKGAARIGSGDLTARVDGRGFSPELRNLAESFNSMATQLVAHDKELKRANHLLSELAATDGMTELANRRRFDEQIDSEWRRASRTGECVALLLVDVDNFKKFNDRYGHLEGDQCLRQVASVLKGAGRRPGDLAARTGGEEFAILLPGAQIGDAAAIAEAVRQDVADLGIGHLDNPGGVVTVSIGLAAFKPRAGQSSRLLLDAADRALYRAKREGRNRVATHRGPVALAS